MSDQVQVLHVNRVGFLGGVERVILTLATEMRASPYTVRLACPGNGDLAKAASDLNVPVTPCPFDRMRITTNPLSLGRYLVTRMRASRHVLQICEQHAVKLIHAHHPVGVLYAIKAKADLGIPVVLHVHEILPARLLYRLALRYVSRWIDRYICVSQASRELVEACADIGAKPVSVVHNGVDPSFHAGATVAKSAAVLGPGPHFGVFGVIEPRKGQHVFLQAAQDVARRHPSARFWIVGPLALEDKAGYAARLRRLADQPGLAGRVTFVGYTENVRAWMESMDVVVLSSVANESLSMVLLEALVLGRPTIGTNVGGGAEAIKDGVTGRLVPPGDADALGSAMEQMLSEAGAAMGARAAEDARIRFMPDVFCRRIAAIYDDVLSAAG